MGVIGPDLRQPGGLAADHHHGLAQMQAPAQVLQDALELPAEAGRSFHGQRGEPAPFRDRRDLKLRAPIPMSLPAPPVDKRIGIIRGEEPRALRAGPQRCGFLHQLVPRRLDVCLVQEKHPSVLGKICEGSGGIGIKIGEVKLQHRERNAAGQGLTFPLEGFRLRGGLHGWLPGGQPLRDRRAVGRQRLPGRQDANLLDRPERPLRDGMEGAHGGDAVRFPLDPDRLRNRRGEEIHDPPAAGELPGLGDDGDRLIPGLQEIPEEALHRKLLAGPQDPAQAVEKPWRQRAEEQGADGGHHHRRRIPVQTRQGGQGGQALRADLRRPRRPLVRERRGLRQPVDPLHPQPEGQVLGHPLGPFCGPRYNQHRPQSPPGQPGDPERPRPPGKRHLDAPSHG